MSHAENGRRSLPATLTPAACWRWVAEEVRAFVAREALDARGVVVLLPFAQHLPLARAAWAALAEAAWMPRFETTQTLAAAVGAPAESAPGALSLDPVADRLRATRLLREAAPAWPRSDPRGFEQAVREVVDTAHALARARTALPPGARPEWVARARAALSGAAGPDERERSLARLALEWSLGADTSVADALHALEPAGWVALRAGAAEPLAEALLAARRAPALWLEADRAPAAAPEAAVTLAACDDLEDEAQRSAARVLQHLARGERPVALIALDRVLLRRVRALLERQAVPVADETGWKLSTTRAGARVASLLRAARPDASTDELLDALKSSPLDGPGVDALESACRRAGTFAVRHVDAAHLDPAAAALWQAWTAGSEPLRTARRAPLADWLRRLEAALRGVGLWEALAADAAGAQVLVALRCALPQALGAGPAARSAALPADAADMPLEAAGFGRWVDDVLEQVAYAPPAPALEGEAPVVVTPLARAMLRPFAAVVCPGADAARLGAAPPAPPLLGDALAVALGLPGAAQRRADEQQAFAQLLRAPRLTLLHRARDGAEPLQPSPLLLRLRLAATRAGRALAEERDGRLAQAVAPRPTPRPAPSAAALLPESLDATAYEALRTCPYRFFAQRMLRLQEPEELDDALDKRDYGSWLHAVLQEFHARRGEAGDAAGDAALLAAVAHEQQRRLQREDADFLPYAAWFERLAPRYLQWLHAEEAAGARVHATELALQATPAALEAFGMRLQGRLDRLDLCRRDGARVLRIVDYKTSSGASLRARLRDPAEDTQLPFYAALLAAARPDEAQDLEALYLALDDREGVVALPHADVQESAERLLEGLAHDLLRLREGAPLPALGEGAACETCSARGLCRRDHWGAAGAGPA